MSSIAADELNKPKPSEPNPSEPSICIPRVFKSTTRKDLYNVVERLDLGPVDRIDMVAKTNTRGECYNKVFIHFKMWNKKNPTVQATRAQLLRGEEVKIVYSEPWFWKCTASRHVSYRNTFSGHCKKRHSQALNLNDNNETFRIDFNNWTDFQQL